MKLPSLLPLLGAILLVAGCATENQKKENLLTSAGFRTKPAVDTQQIQMLHSLPANKVSAISHHGHILFVYPDAAHNNLYVGTQTEYAAYVKLRTTQKIVGEDASTAQFNQQEKWADMDGWKGLSDGWYNF